MCVENKQKRTLLGLCYILFTFNYQNWFIETTFILILFLDVCWYGFFLYYDFELLKTLVLFASTLFKQMLDPFFKLFICKIGKLIVFYCFFVDKLRNGLKREKDRTKKNNTKGINWIQFLFYFLRLWKPFYSKKEAVKWWNCKTIVRCVPFIFFIFCIVLEYEIKLFNYIASKKDFYLHFTIIQENVWIIKIKPFKYKKKRIQESRTNKKECK